MTYEEFLKSTKENLKRFFPESFQARKVEIREVLKIGRASCRERV